MKKYAKPTTGAFILNPNMAESFFNSNHITSKDALARFEKNQKKTPKNKEVIRK